jgi:cytochrome c-type biogenesis protein CcmH
MFEVSEINNHDLKWNQDNRMKLVKPLVIIIGFLFVNLNVIGKVYAQELIPTPSDDEVNAIAKHMYCPVCENIPLDVCPTVACQQWRDQIKEKLSAGWSEEEIKDYFVLQYGDRVLAEPPRRGINWLIYILPPLILIIGAFILYRTMRSWKKPLGQIMEEDFHTEKTHSIVDGEGNEEDKYIAKLEEELRRRR